MPLTLRATEHIPFEGATTISDVVRLLVIVAAICLAFVIGRVIREGVSWHDMDRYQMARFIGLAGLAVVSTIFQLNHFGTHITGYTVGILVFLIISWVGVLGERMQQRRRRQGVSATPRGAGTRRRPTRRAQKSTAHQHRDASVR